MFKNILTVEKINKVDPISLFRSYNLGNEVYGELGKEHYRLLSYFSTLVDNKNIIEIGTHNGEGTVALSYNKSNTIYSFDIIDKISQDKDRKNIKNIKNIKLLIDDIMTNIETRNKYKELILTSSFIFMDVDPHNGLMEYDFYTFLKENNYNGFVICDDIKYFQGMRDNFWNKIPDEYKYDITHLGHWSGTGIFTFNKEIQFDL